MWGQKQNFSHLALLAQCTTALHVSPIGLLAEIASSCLLAPKETVNCWSEPFQDPINPGPIQGAGNILFLRRPTRGADSD